MGCPGPEKHCEGGDNQFCGCWEAYEKAVGGREATRQTIKLVALNIKDILAQPPDSPVSHVWSRKHSLKSYLEKGQ